MSKSWPSPSEGGRWRLTEAKGSLAVRGLAGRMGNIDFFFFLAEVTGALQGVSWHILKPHAVKMHFPRRSFMSKGGRTQTPIWITMWNRERLLIRYFMKGWLHRRDKWDWVPLAADKRRVALWMDWTENAVKKKRLVWGTQYSDRQKSGPFMQIHTHTHKRAPNSEGSRRVYEKQKKKKKSSQTQACIWKYIQTSGLFVHAWFSPTTIFHSSFVSHLFILIGCRNGGGGEIAA